MSLRTPRRIFARRKRRVGVAIGIAVACVLTLASSALLGATALLPASSEDHGLPYRLHARVADAPPPARTIAAQR